MAVLDIHDEADALDAPGNRTAAPVRSAWRSAPIMSVALLGVYLLLNLVADPTGHLITDVGGKAATLEAMSQRGDLDPDLGYRFEEFDPAGAFHPVHGTALTESGRWVNTTSLTMIYPMRPLYDLGGLRLALLIPMLGSVLTALGAAALERRMSDGSNGSWSFWIVGLTGPAVIYALDIWEHSLSLGAMTIGAVGVNDAVESDRPLRSAAVAGMGFGFAATMRQEALVYGVVAGLAVVVITGRRRSITRAVTVGTTMAMAALVPLVGHTLVELAVLGEPLRLNRSTGTIAQEVGLLERLDTAFLTLWAMSGGGSPIRHVFGLLLATGIAWLTIDLLRGREPGLSQKMVVAMFAFMALVLAVEFGPVPGLFAAAPLAVAGAMSAFERRLWLPLGLGVAPLPIVAAVQFTIGTDYQWGSRYMLLSGLVLTVAAVTGLRASHTKFLVGLALVGFLITAYGSTWAIHRMNETADDRRSLAAATAPDEVVIWRSDPTARELSLALVQDDRRWLSAPTPELQTAVVALLDEAGIDEFIWIDEDPSPLESFRGFEATEELLTLDYMSHRLTRFVRASS